MSKLSVIMPVYDTEKYVGECLESIFSQNIADLEVIAIDDGSPDDSISILREFAAKHPNLQIIQQENAGISAARNRGIEQSTGDYLCFIDSDDHFREGALENAFAIAVENDLDFITFALDQFPEKPHAQPECNGARSGVMTGPELLKYTTDNKYLVSWPCLHICKRSLFDEESIGFVEGMTFEGNPFHLALSRIASRAMHVNEPLYHYRIRTDSLSHSQVTPQQVHNLVCSLAVMSSIAESADVPEAYSWYFFNRVHERFKGTTSKYLKLTPEQRAELRSICSPKERMHLHAIEQAANQRELRVKQKKQAERQKRRLEKQNKQLEKQLASLNERQEKIRASLPYKIGRAISAPARAIKKPLDSADD